MDRFILHEIYGMSAEDRKRFDLGKYAYDGSLLEDTVTGETYMDGWEPEDATFIRDLGWVPALLNTLAEETATQRAEVERLKAERDAARRDAERTYAGWVCGASMDHGTVTVKIDGDPEAVAGVHLGEKARAMVHLFAYPRTSRR